MKNSKVSSQANATPVASARHWLLGALITSGGASLLVGSALLGRAPQTAPGATANAVTSAPQTSSAPARAEVPYTPSKFPGVMVRNVPAVATGGARKGWIYLKPGAKRTAVKARYGTRSGHVWYEAGKTSAGGTIAHVDSSFYPAVVAHIKHDGKAHSHLEIKY